ncbi:MAG: hypothetical protein PHG85_04580 [Candidatus Altiarchaeota archaeon]|nr:hypothetical protein [Candidatus Altiarchaeota archaeon]
MRSALALLFITLLCGCLYGAKAPQDSAASTDGPYNLSNETDFSDQAEAVDTSEYTFDCDTAHVLERHVCYWQSAVRLRNASICGLIQQGERDYCYLEVALSLNDSSVCSFVECTAKRQICVGRIAQDSNYPRVFNCSYGCSKEGEYVSMVSDYVDMYPVECCEGLTPWWSGMDDGIAVDETCYESGKAADRPVGVCIRCGDGVCGDLESVCSCPEDCTGKGKSMTAKQFCSMLYRRYCDEDNAYLPLCQLC